ncbi:PDZ domain-containing protein [Planctomycetota bacterium]
MVKSASSKFRETTVAIRELNLALVVACCIVLPCGVAEAQKEASPVSSSNPEQNGGTAFSVEQISQWVADLDSDSYIVRRTATDRLVTAGLPTIDPLVDVVPTASLEVVTRSIHILQELAASSDYATGTAAFLALEKLAEQRATAAARRAQATLLSMASFRRDRAVKYLKSLGAEFETNTVRETALRSRPVPTIRLGRPWKGTKDDLTQLQWIVNVDSNNVEPMLINSKWLLVLDGDKFDDGWLEAITQLDGVHAVRLKKTRVSADGLLHLRNLKGLEFIDVLYTPLGPEAIDRLSRIIEHFHDSRTLRLRLFGTKLDQEKLKQLGEKFNVEIDSKEGAFLGISCRQNESPCQINYVGEGTAAQRGGLQISDIITKYNGVAINDFDQLMQEIAKNVPGDKVSIEITRLDKQETKHVVLGEWDL